MTNHHTSSYTVPPEIAVLFRYHSTVKSILRKLMRVLATLAVLAEESLTQASVHTLSQTLLWMDDKASSP